MLSVSRRFLGSTRSLGLRNMVLYVDSKACDTTAAEKCGEGKRVAGVRPRAAATTVCSE